MTDLQTAEDHLRQALDLGDPRWIDVACREVDEADHAPTGYSMLQAALYYASIGLHVFPLSPGSKLPLKESRGFEDATTDPAQLRRWWKEDDTRNVGIATGHLVDVIDVDGYEALCTWVKLEDTPPVLGVVSTPREGGLHYFIPATGMGNRAGLAKGVDIDYRGIGGYVVAPPSRLFLSRTESRSYVWLRPIPSNLAARVRELSREKA